jgi:hypothetical protein
MYGAGIQCDSCGKVEFAQTPESTTNLSGKPWPAPKGRWFLLDSVSNNVFETKEHFCSIECLVELHPAVWMKTHE